MECFRCESASSRLILSESRLVREGRPKLGLLAASTASMTGGFALAAVRWRWKGGFAPQAPAMYCGAYDGGASVAPFPACHLPPTKRPGRYQNAAATPEDAQCWIRLAAVRAARRWLCLRPAVASERLAQAPLAAAAGWRGV